jgi:Uma2 family endonuclease
MAKRQIGNVGKDNSDMAVNPSLAPSSGTMDVDEFMAFLETRPHGEHWELIEGVAVMMAPATYAHQRIAYNFCNLLNDAFNIHRPDLFAYFDVGVRTKGIKNFQPQPDVVVVPGVAGYNHYSERYQLVAEFLSPTNARREINLKLHIYREATDNLYAVVIEPREFLVEIHAKCCNWRPQTLTQATDPIELPEFGLACRVCDLYRGTPLNPVSRGAHATAAVWDEGDLRDDR